MIIFIFIYIITSVLIPLLPQNPYINATIKGILEITQGLIATSNLNIDMHYKGTLSIMLLSFGGISIYIQIISILSDTDLNTLRGRDTEANLTQSIDPDIRRIERAQKNMPEEDKKFMMDMLMRSFSEYFEDDGSDDPD